jgi:hypothetical protein
MLISYFFRNLYPSVSSFTLLIFLAALMFNNLVFFRKVLEAVLPFGK